jgi:hypothetical protein
MLTHQYVGTWFKYLMYETTAEIYKTTDTRRILSIRSELEFVKFVIWNRAHAKQY